jgi:hypothetical protein
VRKNNRTPKVELYQRSYVILLLINFFRGKPLAIRLSIFKGYDFPNYICWPITPAHVTTIILNPTLTRTPSHPFNVHYWNRTTAFIILHYLGGGGFHYKDVCPEAIHTCLHINVFFIFVFHVIGKEDRIGTYMINKYKINKYSTISSI